MFCVKERIFLFAGAEHEIKLSATMKKKIWWLAGLFAFLCFTVEGRAESYDALWQKVKQYEKRDLPKSALKVVEQIAGKAGREQHKGQRMAALLYGCRLRQAVVPDSFYTDILKLERLKRQASDEVERAVLASVLGELYDENSGRNRNNSQRTDAHPDSLREWSAAQFRKASADNYALSMAHPALLAEAKAADYMPFVERGADASCFDGDLLNVIGRRAAQSCEGNGREAVQTSNAYYGQMLSVYRQRGNREAELFLSLDSLSGCVPSERESLRNAYWEQWTGGDRKEREQIELRSDYYKRYRQLLSQFGDLPVAAEVYMDLLELQVTDSLKYRWAEEGYARYKTYPRAKDLLNSQRELEAADFSLSFPPECSPEVPFQGVVRHRNLSGVTLHWYLLPDGVPQGKEAEQFRKDHRAYAKSHGRLQKTQQLDWESQPVWRTVEDTFALSAPGVGYYVIIGEAAGVKFTKNEMWVDCRSTRLDLVSSVLPDSVCLCTVVDRKSGSPVEGATVEWWRNGMKIFSVRTDAEGKARWQAGGYLRKHPSHGSFGIHYYKGDDRCNLGGTCSIGTVFHENTGMNEEIRLYTDRSIYRPGQTVHVGGLCMAGRNGEEKAVPGRKVTLTLCDPNRKNVAERTVQSDEMGAFSESFTLPVNGLSGLYYVQTERGRVDFTVEEYKRPTFEVRLDEVDDCLQSGGDTLRLTGEAVNYNGVPVRDARVSATTSVSRWLYAARPEEGESPLDTVYTDREGRFVLYVPVRQTDRPGVWRGLRQLVEVSVLSAAGETQTARTSFPLTKDGLQLSLELPADKLMKDSLPAFTVWVRSSTGSLWKDTVTVTGDIYHTPVGKPKEKVLSGIHFPANRAVRLAECAVLPSGCYELAVRAVAEGDTAEAVRPFTLFSLSDTRPADGVTAWFHCVNDTVEPGRPARLMVGSAADSVSLYYMLFCESRIVEEKLVHLSDSILHFVYPEVSVGADGLQALFYFVKNGECHTYSQHLVLRKPDRGLRLSWVTFRDRLQPGAEETWRLRVTLPDGRPAPAQLMSVLYDASLDGIKPHAWHWPQWFNYSLPNVSVGKFWWYGGSTMSYDAPVRYLTVKGLSFDRFDPVALSWRYWGGNTVAIVEEVFCGTQRAGNLIMAKAAPRSLMAPADAEQAMVADEASATAGTGGADGGEPGEGEARPARSDMRGDLQETAFFYPRLMADPAGVVTLHFTLPEGLTTWKFMALAHTADMHAATFTDEVLAQKEVMAQLNLPRFVRMGDRATLTASLFNLTGKALDGTVTMEVFDPATEKTLWRESLNVSLSEDTVVNFVYEPTGEVTLPACRVMFEADDYADGEQRYLPVLEDKEWLTQTLPFIVPNAGDTVVNLERLFQQNHPDADARRLTVDYTARPLWYAVQALPSVLQSQTDDALSLGAAYYASVLSTRLAGRYPQIKTALAAWRQDGGNVLQSPLAAQEELTGIVLEETPWVSDADRETQRIQALQQLFDVNRQSDLRHQFAAALGRLQQPDGSFGWFKGMSGNVYLTRRVARLLLRSGAGVQSDSLLEQSVNVRRMMSYLIGETHKDILKDKEWHAEHKAYLYDASHWLDMLYLMQLCDASWTGDASRKDKDYMQARVLEGMYGLALADKAEAAVVLHRIGKTDAAEQMMRSVREHLVDGPEGLHLEYPSGGFVTSDRKMAVHTMMMEAFSATGLADKETSDGLCRWLLSQKRVQAWSTAVTSMDAVYALMQGKGEELTLRSADRIRLETPQGREIASLDASRDGVAGLGTVSVTVEGRELDGGAGRLEITKTDNASPGWGAAYAQFRLPLSEVESAAAGMRVRVETDNLQPEVGDRLTLRYVITADRDYEYVCLKASRAACLEPVEALSGYEYGNGLGYYKEVKDVSTRYYFERLPKGTYVLEMECYVERPGRYAVGAAKLNGVYAPEFSAYDAGPVLEVRP